jgi:hypothetical protein
MQRIFNFLQVALQHKVARPYMQRTTLDRLPCRPYCRAVRSGEVVDKPQSARYNRPTVNAPSSL